jgi:hypothetical protein
VGLPDQERTGHAVTYSVLFTSLAATLFCAGADYGSEKKLWQI